MLVFGEATENPCPAWISVTDVRHGCPSQTVPPVRIPAVCRPTDGRWYSAVMGAFPGKVPYVDEP